MCDINISSGETSSPKALLLLQYFPHILKRVITDDCIFGARFREIGKSDKARRSATILLLPVSNVTFASEGSRSVKLTQLIPIENCVINGYSLIENVFGANIVVHDVLGVMHTTAKNVKLLCRAQTLLENRHCYDAQGLASALMELREEADFIDQCEYDQAVWRERLAAEPPRVAAIGVGFSA